MNETAACNILLLRAFETQLEDPRWTDADRAWANQAALEQSGAGNRQQPADFIAQRALLGAQRLAERDPQIRRLQHSLSWRPWVGPLIAAVAVGLGMFTDMIGAEKKVNLLAPPLLGVLSWNLLVYALMLTTRAWRIIRGSSKPQSDKTDGPISRLVGWLAHGGGRPNAGEVAVDGLSTAPAAVFTRDWIRNSAPLTSARSGAILHFAAAGFAAGALISLYLRGLGLEYLAGWESTFLDAPAVGSLLGIIFGPASWLSSIAVPDVAGIAAMHFRSAIGVNAAPWIHLYAITLGLFVIAPRVVLGLINSLRAVRLRERFALDTDSPYFESLARVLRGDAAHLVVVPYSYRLTEPVTNTLNRLLGRVHGADAKITVMPPVAQGDEDDWRAVTCDVPAAIAVVLYAMTATPEHENHGAFARRIKAQLPAATALLPLVDESSFRRRFGHQAGRLEQRRSAWRMVLSTAGVTPIFVDLSGPVPPQTEQLVLEAINAAIGARASAKDLSEHSPSTRSSLNAAR